MRRRIGVAGPVLVPLCGPCKSGMSGTIKVSSSDGKQIDAVVLPPISAKPGATPPALTEEALRDSYARLEETAEDLQITILDFNVAAAA